MMRQRPAPSSPCDDNGNASASARRDRRSPLFEFLARFASRPVSGDRAEKPEPSPPAPIPPGPIAPATTPPGTTIHHNTLGSIVARLRLPRNACILDVGGAPYHGSETVDWVLDATDEPIDIVAARADQADALRQKYGAKVRVFGAIDEIGCGAYDLVVITPVLGQVAHSFRVLLAFEYARLVRAEGFVTVLGIGASRTVAVDTPGLADELALFNAELDLDKVKKGAVLARGLFKYVGHQWRKPSTRSFFVWTILQRTDKPAVSPPDAVKWWRLLPSGNSYVLAANAAFLEAFYDRSETDPAAAFDLLPADEQVAPEIVHYALRALFNARKMAAYEDALARLAAQGYADLLLYHRVNLDRYDGVFRCDLGQAVLRYRDLPERNFLKRALFNVLVDQLARSLDRDLLISLLDLDDPGRVRALPQAIAVGVCGALTRLGLPQKCRDLMAVYLAERSSILRLQFLEIERDLARKPGPPGADGEPGNGDWRSVLDRVRRERVALLGDRVSAAEIAAYNALACIPQGPDDLLDIRFSDGQQHRLKQLIEQSVIAGRPLSLVRLGDGESYAFDNSEDNATLREMTWWGRRPDEKTRTEIKRRVRRAVYDADILGIPSIYRIIRHLTDPVGADGADNTGTLPSLATVLTAIADHGLLADRVVTEERCHHLIFDREYLAKLTKMARRTIWVTCWNPGQLGVEDSGGTVFVTIPAHAKTRDLGNGEDQPLFDIFNAKIAQMCGSICAGSVVFVSAGLIGKIFVAEAAKCGAAALDVGAMADYLAGRKTRTSADII